MFEKLRLEKIEGQGVLVYYSSGYEDRARDLMTLVTDTRQYLIGLLEVDVPVVLAVLNRDDWRRSRRAPYGYPHSNTSLRAVIAPAVYPDALHQGSRGLFEAAPEELRGQLLAGDRTLGEQVTAFFDLVLVHEVAHLFMHERRLAFGLQWLTEFCANYLTYCYLSARRPDLRDCWIGWAAIQAAFPETVFHSLDEFEREQGRIAFANFSWYQGHFNLQVRELYRCRGEALVADLVKAFSLSPEAIRARLDWIAPTLAAWASSFGSESAGDS